MKTSCGVFSGGRIVKSNPIEMFLFGYFFGITVLGVTIFLLHRLENTKVYWIDYKSPMNKWDVNIVKNKDENCVYPSNILLDSQP